MSPPKPRHIHGPRPPPLLLHKHSRTIRKPSPPPQLRRPVIIYTHSPKIIHTQPKDFMALVQRLTGCSPPNADKAPSDNNDSSSVVTEEDSNCPLFTPRSLVNSLSPSFMEFLKGLPEF
ncbi:VQ motif-containing protein 8, chloroplastic, partial [Cucurbita argyrosperma subsp. argyrosperma]